MDDIELQTGSEFMVSGCYGLTERGTDFIDAWVPAGDSSLTARHDQYIVIDAGKIVIADYMIPQFESDAAADGVTIAKTKAQV